jgi:hypothetical protein
VKTRSNFAVVGQYYKLPRSWPDVFLLRTTIASLKSVLCRIFSTGNSDLRFLHSVGRYRPINAARIEQIEYLLLGKSVAQQ